MTFQLITYVESLSLPPLPGVESKRDPIAEITRRSLIAAAL
jgi:hypothetical protein